MSRRNWQTATPFAVFYVAFCRFSQGEKRQVATRCATARCAEGAPRAASLILTRHCKACRATTFWAKNTTFWLLPIFPAAIVPYKIKITYICKKKIQPRLRAAVTDNGDISLITYLKWRRAAPTVACEGRAQRWHRRQPLKAVELQTVLWLGYGR